MSNVTGVYDRIEVANSSILHNGKTVPITWINMYTFYFKWDSKNEQIWTFDTTNNGLYQICNSVPPQVMNNLHTRHTTTPVTRVPKHYGNFNGTLVNEENIFHGGNSIDIEWINPLTFYVKFAVTNEQIWTYDATVSAYLQLGNWKTAVKDAINHKSERTHRN